MDKYRVGLNYHIGTSDASDEVTFFDRTLHIARKGWFLKMNYAEWKTENVNHKMMNL